MIDNGSDQPRGDPLTCPECDGAVSSPNDPPSPDEILTCTRCSRQHRLEAFLPGRPENPRDDPILAEQLRTFEATLGPNARRIK